MLPFLTSSLGDGSFTFILTYPEYTSLLKFRKRMKTCFEVIRNMNSFLCFSFLRQQLKISLSKATQQGDAKSSLLLSKKCISCNIETYANQTT